MTTIPDDVRQEAGRVLVDKGSRAAFRYLMGWVMDNADGPFLELPEDSASKKLANFMLYIKSASELLKQ